MTGRESRPNRLRARATLLPLPPTTSRTLVPRTRSPGRQCGTVRVLSRQGLSVTQRIMKRAREFVSLPQEGRCPSTSERRFPLFCSDPSQEQRIAAEKTNTGRIATTIAGQIRLLHGLSRSPDGAGSYMTCRREVRLPTPGGWRLGGPAERQHRALDQGLVACEPGARRFASAFWSSSRASRIRTLAAIHSNS